MVFNIEQAIRWIRGDSKKVKFLIHSKTNENDVAFLLNTMKYQPSDVYKDKLAHIINITDTAVAYRVDNEIYIIPATAKTVPAGVVVNDTKPLVLLAFDYPCEMKREDLVEY